MKRERRNGLGEFPRAAKTLRRYGIDRSLGTSRDSNSGSCRETAGEIADLGPGE